MRWDTREPCESCPYRVDAQPEKWHQSEFEKLLMNNANEYSGAIYSCHSSRLVPEGSTVCAGWLLDQQRRGLPSIQLRVILCTNEAAVMALEEVSDGGHELYDSIEEMCKVNGV